MGCEMRLMGLLSVGSVQQRFLQSIPFLEVYDLKKENRGEGRFRSLKYMILVARNFCSTAS